jgi:hypothetical protein
MAVAAQLIKDADAMCPSTGFRDCSAIDLLSTVRERDHRVWANPGKTGAP